MYRYFLSQVCSPLVKTVPGGTWTWSYVNCHRKQIWISPCLFIELDHCKKGEEFRQFLLGKSSVGLGLWHECMEHLWAWVVEGNSMLPFVQMPKGTRSLYMPMYFMFPTLDGSFLIWVCLGLPHERPHLLMHFTENPNLGLHTALRVNNLNQKCHNEVLHWSDTWYKEINTWLRTIVN